MKDSIKIRIQEFKSKASIIKRTVRNTSPAYIFDRGELDRNYLRYVTAFKKASAEFQVFYAVKSNPYHLLLKRLVRLGSGLDVSSRRELELALKAGARKIVYTGPGKTRADLVAALAAKRKGCKIVVHLESFTELEILGDLLKGSRLKLDCGVRVHLPAHKEWTKFGIPLKQLVPFFAAAKARSGINLCGIHFHQSFTRSSKPYIYTLRKIAAELRTLNRDERANLRFVDLGGGLMPPVFEGYYPWNPKGLFLYANSKHFPAILGDKFRPRYLPSESMSIERFAGDVTKEFKAKIKPLCPNAEMFLEPGRYISYSTMHLVFSVSDIKPGKILIVNTGINMIGYEKHQYFTYVPIFNLDRFSIKKEEPYLVFGSLCTHFDILGYYIYGKGVQVGDLLCMPYQGDYTYTWAQNFIKPIPPVVNL